VLWKTTLVGVNVHTTTLLGGTVAALLEETIIPKPAAAALKPRSLEKAFLPTLDKAEEISPVEAVEL
jgi:hypothetical protein